MKIYPFLLISTLCLGLKLSYIEPDGGNGEISYTITSREILWRGFAEIIMNSVMQLDLDRIKRYFITTQSSEFSTGKLLLTGVPAVLHDSIHCVHYCSRGFQVQALLHLFGIANTAPWIQLRPRFLLLLRFNVHIAGTKVPSLQSCNDQPQNDCTDLIHWFLHCPDPEYDIHRSDIINLFVLFI